MVLPDPHEVGMEDLQKDRAGVSGGGTGIRAGGHKTVGVEAVEKLPPKQKTVLILYYYNDMPIREIAKVCGVFEGTVKSRLYHAKEQLKKVLTQEEGGKTWTILS